MRLLKDNRWIRGLWCLYTNYFGICRKRFGYISDSVIVTPPFSGDLKNIYVYDNVGIGHHSVLSTPKAKIVFKGNTSVAHHLSIHTGNHARLVGKYVTDITLNSATL